MGRSYETKSCKDLQDKKFDLYCNYNQNADDLEFVKGCAGLSDNITGAIGQTENGDIIELWVSECNRPWDLNALFMRVI